MATHLTWTRKSYWRARGPDGEYVAKESGSTNFATPEELWEGIANSPLRGEFDVEPARFRVSKGYGVLSPDTGDTSPPTVPTDLSASALSASSIFLSWTASTDNVGVTEYQVYRNGVPIDTTTDTEYTDTGLIPSTQYSYQVSASDAAGNSSALTAAVLATTNANSAPSWSTSAQSLTIGVAYSLALSSVCSDADGHTLTFTQVSGTLPAGLTFSNGVVSGTPTTAQAPSVTFRASDGYTTTDQVITFTVTQADTTPPDVPTGLAVGTPASNSLPLSWDANPSGQGLAGYKLYRSTNGVNYGLHQTLPTSPPSYNDGSLNADTTYYYKLSAFDNATPVANESAQSAAVSGRTAVASTLTWSGNPFPMTVPAGSYVDLEQYISDPANELGSVISIGAAFPSGASISGPPTVATWRVAAASGATLQTTIGHQLRLVRSAEYDWQQRISAAGVVWYHPFTSAAEVNRFRWQGGIGNDLNGTGDTNARHITTDGVGWNGCLEINVPQGGTSASGWSRPYSPLTGATNGRGVDDPGAGVALSAWNVTHGTDYLGQWKKGFYGHTDYHNSFSGFQFDGNEFYIQFRVKISASRFLSGEPDGKLAFLGVTGNGTSHVTPWHEIVLQSLRSRVLRAYTNFGSSFNSALTDPQRASDASGTIKQPGGDYADTCINNLNCTICWCWPSDTWVTTLMRIRAGHHGTSLSQTSAQDTLLEIKVALPGDTSYTTIYSKSDYVIEFGGAGVPYGWSVFEPSGYMNGVSSPNGFTQRFAQVIFSKQPIACPQV